LFDEEFAEQQAHGIFQAVAAQRVQHQQSPDMAGFIEAALALLHL
jgi:hypothetical protein